MNYDIENTLWAYLTKNFLPQNSEFEYEENDNLFESGIIDSAGLISFVSYIEKKFNIMIPDEDLLPEHFSSIETIASYIRSRKLKESEAVLEKL